MALYKESEVRIHCNQSQWHAYRRRLREMDEWNVELNSSRKAPM